MNGNGDFVDDLNGDQFPSITIQDRVNVMGGNQDCLDQGLTDNVKRNEGFVDDPNGDQFPPISAQDRFDDLGQVTYNEARYHLRRMWNKFGYLDLMRNDEGVFFFKFQDERGMEEVISNGPCALTSSVGKPIIMDDMTARICAKGEGRINFARVLIEVEAVKGLKKEIEVAYKGNTNHEKFTKIIKVEYAWKPPCWDKCKVFRNDNKNCMVKEREMHDTINEQNMNNSTKFADVVKNRKVNYEKVNEIRAKISLTDIMGCIQIKGIMGLKTDFIMEGVIMATRIIGKNKTKVWGIQVVKVI
nr:hypothetical protein [Tanacetum cinerariifolium]